MASDRDLFTIEESHGKPRLTGPRPSDLGTVEPSEERAGDRDERGRFSAGNRASANRSARRAVARPLRDARKRFQEATQGQPPSAADELLNAAMAVYQSASLELGSKSVFVTAHAATFATEHVLAGHYINRAAAVGFDTDAGAAFVELAHACEQQASRAMTAALAALKSLPKRSKGAAPGFVEVDE